MNMVIRNSEFGLRVSRHFAYSVALALMCFALPAEIVGQTGVLPWESRPYEVTVWVCTSGEPEFLAVEERVNDLVMSRAELIDPSGWNVKVESAPAPWSNRLLQSIDQPGESLEKIFEIPQLELADKMIAVCLTREVGQYRYRVREYDILTQQWGAIVSKRVAYVNQLDSNLFVAIKKAFMPIARIDRVSDAGVVYTRARAVNSCVMGNIHTGETGPIESSPVWIRPSDRMLPVIRRIDRQGNLAKLEPVEFTYLTIDTQAGSRMECQFHSRQRAPLAGRSSRRAQKLALVIRPPENNTELRLVSKTDENESLSGYEIYSRRPGAKREEASEYLGYTDWRGILEIPPSEHGLRLIYVKRGARALMKLPVIPGLFDRVTTAVPDDEARLNAEGVIQGLHTEVLNLVAQRQIYENQIKSAITVRKFDYASELLQRYEDLVTPQELKIQMGDEESRLKALTGNKRELEQISTMFTTLRDILNRKIGNSIESELRRYLQAASSQ